MDSRSNRPRLSSHLALGETRPLSRDHRPGVSPEQAQADLDRVASSFRERFAQAFATDSGWGLRSASLLRAETQDIRPALWALLGAGGLVLLITCANLGNLLSLRAQRRGREIAVRMALGATRRRVVQQILLVGSRPRRRGSARAPARVLGDGSADSAAARGASAVRRDGVPGTRYPLSPPPSSPPSPGRRRGWSPPPRFRARISPAA